MKDEGLFFIISNFNTDPERYLNYCSDYLIYDQSNQEPLKSILKEKYRKIQFVEHTGHNLSDYFRFFHEAWNSLPETMMLAKGNMIDRHVSLEFFERVVSNRVLTYLYDDRTYREIPGVSSQLYDGHLLELNTSWYVKTKPYYYFGTFNSLLRFIFKDPLIPSWIVFSPGACYIVPRHHVKHYPEMFWMNLKKLVSYIHFPAEAYILERMLPIIFANIYVPNDWMLNDEKFSTALEEVAAGQHYCLDDKRSLRGQRIKTLLHHGLSMLRK